MNKNKLTKEAQVLDKKINELAKTTTRKLKQVKPEGVDHSRSTSQKLKASETKKQKWILVNKQGKLSGILDHSAFNTRESAKESRYTVTRTKQIELSTVHL